MVLEELRAEMDDADRLLLAAFEKRMVIAAQISEVKRENGLPVQDAAREEAVISHCTALAVPELKPYVAPLYECLFTLSRDYQNKLLQRKETP